MVGSSKYIWIMDMEFLIELKIIEIKFNLYLYFRSYLKEKWFCRSLTFLGLLWNFELFFDFVDFKISKWKRIHLYFGD